MFRKAVNILRGIGSRGREQFPLGLSLALLSFWPQVVPAMSVESVIEAPGPKGPLKGVLMDPSLSRGPIAIIIPGSGPTDLDGNSPLGIHAATYRLLAEGLAARKISTLRIDKRGLFSSGAAVQDANAVTITDYAGDVRTWAATITKKMGVRCAWLIGHSEGALVALAAAQGQPNVCGVISIAGPGERMGELMRAQIKANPANAPLVDNAASIIDSLESGKRVDASIIDPALHPLFRPEVQGFLIDLFSYDPTDLIKSLNVPVLIVQGERDLQVTIEEARRLKAARPAATLSLFPNVNHVLKEVAVEDVNANYATYSDPDLPLAPGVSDAVASFIVGSKT